MQQRSRSDVKLESTHEKVGCDVVVIVEDYAIMPTFAVVQ